MVKHWLDHWIGGTKCSINTTNFNNFLTDGVIWTGLVSDVMSIISSVLIIVSFYAYKDMQTEARRFLLYISIADVLNSSWFLFAHIWSLHDIRYSSCYVGKTDFELGSCILQSAMNTYFTITSFYWTIVLALYILALLFHKNWFSRKCVRISMHLIGWGVPLFMMLFGLLSNRFGPGRATASAGWCFIAYYRNESGSTEVHVYSEFLAGKLYDIVTLIALAVIYLIAVIKFLTEKRKLKKRAIGEQEVKLVLIPVGYGFLRIWGTLRCLLELTQTLLHQKRHCFIVLTYLQALGDPGQGWINGILFLLFTKELRKRAYRTITNLKNKFLARNYSSKLVDINSTVYYNTLERCDTKSPIVITYKDGKKSKISPYTRIDQDSV